MKKLLSNALAHPRTSAAGLTLIAGAIFHATTNPSHALVDENTYAAVVGGIGLLLAGDSNNSPKPPGVPIEMPNGLKSGGTGSY